MKLAQFLFKTTALIAFCGSANAAILNIPCSSTSCADGFSRKTLALQKGNRLGIGFHEVNLYNESNSTIYSFRVGITLNAETGIRRSSVSETTISEAKKELIKRVYRLEKDIFSELGITSPTIMTQRLPNGSVVYQGMTSTELGLPSEGLGDSGSCSSSWGSKVRANITSNIGTRLGTNILQTPQRINQAIQEVSNRVASEWGVSATIRWISSTFGHTAETTHTFNILPPTIPIVFTDSRVVLQWNPSIGDFEFNEVQDSLGNQIPVSKNGECSPDKMTQWMIGRSNLAVWQELASRWGMLRLQVSLSLIDTSCQYCEIRDESPSN